MQNNLIFLPVLVQILLTLYLYIRLNIVKLNAVKNGQVNEERRALYKDAWPESVLAVGNSISNQFEAPILFYVLTIILWLLNSVDVFTQVVAWLFVLSRIAHVYIHTGSNVVPIRSKIFKFGIIMIIILSALAFKAVLTG